MKIIDRNTLLYILIKSKEDDYDIGKVIHFANDFIFDEDENIKYTDDFIDNFSNLMLYFDTDASNEPKRYKEIVDSLIESMESKRNITKEDIDKLLKK